MPKTLVAPSTAVIQTSNLQKARSACVKQTLPIQVCAPRAVEAPEFLDQLQAHYRRARRTQADVACDVNVLSATGAVLDQGTARLKNISHSGALVGDLVLEKNSLPLAPFQLVLKLKGGEHDGICIEATPIRFAPEVNGLGVRLNEVFVKI